MVGDVSRANIGKPWNGGGFSELSVTANCKSVQLCRGEALAAILG
jgi:hypothetical protein